MSFLRRVLCWHSNIKLYLFIIKTSSWHHDNILFCSDEWLGLGSGQQSSGVTSSQQTRADTHGKTEFSLFTSINITTWALYFINILRRHQCRNVNCFKTVITRVFTIVCVVATDTNGQYYIYSWTWTWASVRWTWSQWSQQYTSLSYISQPQQQAQDQLWWQLQGENQEPTHFR